MTSAAIITVFVVILVAIAGYFYVCAISGKLSIANAAINKDALVANAQGIVAKIGAHLSGWKTVILAWIAGAVQLLQALPGMLSDDLLHQWQQLPWANVVDAKVANWITIGCALLIPIIHAQGVAHAATTPLVDPGA